MSENLRKNLGGLSSVAITPVRNIAQVSTQGELALVDSSLLEPIELVEQRSSYVAQHAVESGIPWVQHTLKLVVDRQTGRAIAKEYASPRGVAVVVELNSGMKVLVGWSSKFGMEQPLRLTSVSDDSAQRPAQWGVVELCFESRDTSSAIEITNGEF